MSPLKAIKLLAALVGGGAIASLLGLATAQAADKVTYQLDWLPGGDKAPIYVCIDQGICAKEGLEVTIAPGRGSTEAITHLAAGTADVGSSDIGALMAAKAHEKVGVTAIMSIFNKGPHAFYSLTSDKISKIADVRGKKIATSPFTSSNVFLPLVLDAVGLKPSDITLIKADPGALGPMLMTGSADVMIAWMTDKTRYTNQARQAGKEIVVLPWYAAGLDLYSAALLASDKFLAERPDVARRFVKAFRQSIEFCHEHPDEAAKSVTKLVPELDAADVKGSMSDMLALVYNDVTKKDGLGVFEPGRLKETWKRVSKAQSLDPASVDPESAVSRKYLPQS